MTYNIDHYRFLVKLRNSGDTNMYGATPYLQEFFGLDRREARNILTEWMRSFEVPLSEQPKDGRESYG